MSLWNNANKWVELYMANCNQFVSIMALHQVLQVITCGVP